MADVDPRNQERDSAILDGARRLIRELGLARFTRANVAQFSGVSPTSVSNFGRTSISTAQHDTLGYRERILKELMAQAIVDRDVILIAAGLTDGCVKPDDVPADIRAVMGI